MTLGQRVRQQRLLASLSQGALAAKCDVGVDAIARIERDDVNPRTFIIVKIAEALGVSTDTLLKGTTSRPRALSSGYPRRKPHADMD